MAEKDLEELQSLVCADLPKEASAFALAGICRHGSGMDILIRRPVPIPRNHFQIQHELRLEVSSQAINGLCALCENNGLGAVLCHSHPKNLPYSPSDDYGEKRIFDVLRRFIPQGAPAASLLFWPGGITGRVWLAGASRPVPLSEIVVVGRQIKQLRTRALGVTDSPVPEIFDRQVRAFGKEGQTLIRRAKVAVVGVGGTGSATAEQLVRLGVEDLLLVDPDAFEPSNLTRMYGTFHSSCKPSWWCRGQKQQRKVHLVAKHLKTINSRVRICAVPKSVVARGSALNLLDRDVIFLCTDDHWGRAVVNQVVYQYLIPAINLGVQIDAKDGIISGAAGRVDVLRPDVPCLWCREFLQADRIAAESIPQAARASLAREGYVHGLDDPAPAVISMNTALAGMAVTLFLQLLTDFMGESGAISRLIYDVIGGTISRGTTQIKPKCICQKVRGFGDLADLHTQ
jgi:molybdopterin/thiamine biosynthesis adenylyltransferase